MQQYYQITLFSYSGDFLKDDLEKMLEKGRKCFFLFFPRINKLEEIVKLINFISAYKDIKFCIHDKTLLSADNETLLGRNLTFYYMLAKSGITIENISFHIGSLFGFGAQSKKELYSSLVSNKLNNSCESERFFIANYSDKQYSDFVHKAMTYVKNIRQIAEEKNIKILIKNLCLDYAFFSDTYFDYFRGMGYNLDKISANMATIPLLVEMGDFPRHVKEMIKFKEQYDVGISLDMEFLRYLVLVSKKFNIQNEEEMDKWNITLSDENKKMLELYGFFVERGKPVFYEKEIDIYEQIYYLKDIVEIAHLSGSIGPVFVDKNGLNKSYVNTDVLLGILPPDERKFAVKGKTQLASFDGYDETSQKKNFVYDDAQLIWQDIFQRQYLEDIFLLKEIGCNRVVQKMKNISENAINTFNMFNDISDIDFSGD